MDPKNIPRIMDLSKYHESIEQTWNTEPPWRYQIPNAALGITGELGEYFKATERAELGDVMYYVETTRRLFELGPATYEEIGPLWSGIRGVVFELCETVKSYTYHDFDGGDPEARGAAFDDAREDVDDLTGKVAGFVAREAAVHDWDVRKVAADNLYEVVDRHPEGFQNG